ncbi:AMP-binding protein [Gordonia sp. CPCC 206044]|uniref:class I adenylate-forming enzyme family protein n=1 Tax=Gordonia sp. CPCC 206044 TaxID=3140793 RepID=UPI003AF3AF10
MRSTVRHADPLPAPLRMLDCVTAIASAGREFGDVPVYYVERGVTSTTTVGELVDSAIAVAGSLQNMGVGAGDRVVVQLPNGRHCSIAYLAVLLTGATLVPVVHIYGPAEVGFIVDQCQASVIVVPDRVGTTDHTARYAAHLAHTCVRHLVMVGSATVSEAMSWSDLEGNAAYSAPAVRPEDTGLVVYTSGTTSEPKGARHTHGSILAEQRHGRRMLRMDSDAVHLVAFPPGHIAGVHNVLRPILHGRTAIYLDSWDPVIAADIIESHRVTSTAGTPFHLRALLEVPGATGKLASLSEMMVGATGVPAALGREAAAAGIATFRCYGSTEHPTVSCGRVDDTEETRVRTDGYILPDVAVRIVDDGGREVADGDVGEIQTRGDDRFVGYLDSRLDTTAFTVDGWLRSGDRGFVDTEGRLTVTGRIKDVIIRGGETMSPAQIEDVLNTHPAIADGVVVGAPDERYGEIVVAVVILRPGHALDTDDLRAHFAEAGLARQKTPQRIVEVDEFPRTALGKIQKSVLRDRLRAGS